MPDHASADERAAQQREAATPVIAAELRESRRLAEAGALPADRIRSLLGCLGSRYWGAIGPVVKLTPEEHREIKAILSLAIHRQHGGRLDAVDVVWTSDGTELKAGLPT